MPFATKHALPQPPQLLTSSAVLASQPLAALPSQSASGLEQAEMPHTPFTQFGVPPAAEHTLPQPPQLSTLLVVSISQPLAALSSQLA